jgi:DNA (cytosine-5)-methyltransferase 1
MAFFPDSVFLEALKDFHCVIRSDKEIVIMSPKTLHTIRFEVVTIKFPESTGLKVKNLRYLVHKGAQVTSLAQKKKTVLLSTRPKGILKKSAEAEKNSAKKAEEAISAVSFFCGCGGLDLGFVGGFGYKGTEFKRNPFNILSAYDFDAKCIETYKKNISPHAEVKDLSDYNPLSVPAADILIGGFPCQDFATCGPRHGLNSDRGRLYTALMKYMDAHKPMLVVGENVPGLANIDNGKALQTIISDLESCGYRFNVWNLYAPDYGIPQSRTRLFIVGVRNDLPGFPEKPTPTHPEMHRSIKWAIEDLESVDDESIPNQSQHFKASKAKKGNGQGDEVSKADQPSYTIRANAKSRVQFHYALQRRLTIRECARLQTFPDNFLFPHSATSNMMQIGNAVPPMLAHTVAVSIAKYLKKIK